MQLAAQVAALTKQSAADKDTATKTINELKSRLSDQESAIAAIAEIAAAWQDSQKKAVAIANDTEAKRAKMAEMTSSSSGPWMISARKTCAMFKTGMEVLDRYEKFGLGEALFAKEPFIGITRTKFQNLVQDYGDKLEDQRIK